ncbi:MAG: anhydro-N-acetylmuramic acid kinase [Aggregatilineales bacterium]
MKIIGLNSGTSADGLDIALCNISGEPPILDTWIVTAETVPYPGELRDRILTACLPDESRVDDLAVLHFDLAEFAAGAIREFLNKKNFSVTDIDLIASHGQTVWHNVLPNGAVNATLQLTETGVITERTGITVISNFRARDVAAGGQGAPLTAYLDWLLLRHPTEWRAVQNIGGMGNVTFLPPLNDTKSEVLAFDTGPGNALVDIAVHHLTEGVQRYDESGRMAMDGEIDRVWLGMLMQHPYFELKPPKTTGREVFGTEMGNYLVDEGLSRDLSPEDIIATLTALTAHSIAAAYRYFAPADLHDVIIGGGGQHNRALIMLLATLLKPAAIHAHEKFNLSSDHKEALLYAVLAHETWHNRPGSLPAQTGAVHPCVLGQITPGENYTSLIRQTWR